MKRTDFFFNVQIQVVAQMKGISLLDEKLIPYFLHVYQLQINEEQYEYSTLIICIDIFAHFE